jgi:hypothetical protein
MTRTAPVQQVDLTAPSDSLTYVEILTPGGIVRVNTNLADTRTGAPVVVVEVEPNTIYRPKTAPGGEWNVEVRDHLSCFDVRLVRVDGGQREEHRSNLRWGDRSEPKESKR